MIKCQVLHAAYLAKLKLHNKLAVQSWGQRKLLRVVTNSNCEALHSAHLANLKLHSKVCATKLTAYSDFLQGVTGPEYVAPHAAGQLAVQSQAW